MSEKKTGIDEKKAGIDKRKTGIDEKKTALLQISPLSLFSQHTHAVKLKTAVKKLPLSDEDEKKTDFVEHAIPAKRRIDEKKTDLIASFK